MVNPNSHPRDVQQANARCARSAHSRPGAQGKAKPAAAAAMVAADDVGGNTFSFRRAEALAFRLGCHIANERHTASRAAEEASVEKGERV